MYHANYAHQSPGGGQIVFQLILKGMPQNFYLRSELKVENIKKKWKEKTRTAYVAHFSM